MASDYKIFWTKEAIGNLEDILDYLYSKWTQREVDNFKTKLSKQIELIRTQLNLFPKSIYNPRLRKAVLSKQTTIFYEVTNNIIYLAYIFNTKMDVDRIK